MAAGLYALTKASMETIASFMKSITFEGNRKFYKQTKIQECASSFEKTL